MAKIDAFLERMSEQGATRAVLASDAATRLDQADGTSSPGDIVAGEQLKALLDEVLPAEARSVLESKGVAQFTHSAPAGLFAITVQRSGEQLAVEITPAPSAAVADVALTPAPASTPPSPDIFASPTQSSVAGAPTGQPDFDFSQAVPPINQPQPGYPQTGYPQPGYPQPGYPQSGIPPVNYMPEAPNTSGTGAAAEVPPEIRGFNWGGLFLSWIWAVGNRSWIGLLGLVPIIGFFVRFYLGFRGNEMSWRNKKWQSVAAFRSAQQTWGIVGFVFWCGYMLVGVPIQAAIFFPVFARARENARKSECQTREKKIMVAVLQFQEKHEGKFPTPDTAEGWQAQLSPYLADKTIWRCQSYGQDEGISYEINPEVAGVDADELSDPANTPVFWDKESHHLDGRNVAFADGHVKWYREETFQSSINTLSE